MALYVGGMGARGKNFYNDIARRYGYEQEAVEIQDLYLDGKKDEAARQGAGRVAGEVDPGRAAELRRAERVGAFKEAGVTVLSVNPVGPGRREDDRAAPRASWTMPEPFVDGVRGAGLRSGAGRIRGQPRGGTRCRRRCRRLPRRRAGRRPRAAGGFDAERTTPYDHETLQLVFSTTKGATAICVAILADRGLLDYEAKVAEYWPEFAAAGKADITVAQLVSHQAGIPAVDVVAHARRGPRVGADRAGTGTTGSLLGRRARPPATTR